MKILGISSLDKDATVCLLDNGEIKYAFAEERYSRIKMHEGFPHLSLDRILKLSKLSPADIDIVAYPFLSWKDEAKHKISNLLRYLSHLSPRYSRKTFIELKNVVADSYNDLVIQGLPPEKWVGNAPAWKRFIYYLGGGNTYGDLMFGAYREAAHTIASIIDHKKYHHELESNLERLGLLDKLVRVDHHETHAANAFFTSGFEEALIVTLDGYGTGLAGSVYVGREKNMERIHAWRYPNSFGTFYESITAALGFKPSRHEGKIVGLAAYGDPDRLTPAIRARFRETPGDFLYISGGNYLHHRYLASRFTKMSLAAAYQNVLELVATQCIRHFVHKTGLKNIVLSGGVIANVKSNQRIFEIPGVEKIYIHPNMGDGGCSVGAALCCAGDSLQQTKLRDAYLGPEFSKEEIAQALRDEDVNFAAPENLEAEAARLINEGKIVARFNGRMEYGPRALGNRSILYHAREPEVNQWLNHQLGRTEFMPFAPVTLYEYRHECYKNIDGAEHAAEFMTITFDCTEKMVSECPAAVHVDDTARPQLVRKEINPGYYKIVDEYRKLTGIPTLINTSFNMHEEPIVCTPQDAIRAFKLGHLHYMAIGPYLAKGENQGESR